MILSSPTAKAIEMHATWRLYVHPCPAQGCQYRAALDGRWLICAAGHRMRKRQ